VIFYRPTFSGDFRLEPDPDDPKRCRLVAHDPTPAEREKLSAVVIEARKRGWIGDEGGIGDGDTTLVLRASVTTVGTHLFRPGGLFAPGVSLTVASEGGRVVATWDNAAPDAPQLPVVAERADAAVTVDKPHRGGGGGDCPESLASEVLRAFSTPAQWAEWERTNGTMTVHGGHTGRRYRLAHRKTQVRKGTQPTVAVGLDDGNTWHWRHHDYAGPAPVWAFDFLIPPPEEVLALKLTLEHREHWLRNAATMPDATHDLFADPFPGDVDATEAELRLLRIAEEGARGALVGALVGSMMGGPRGEAPHG